jgi:hypothetical protein
MGIFTDHNLDDLHGESVYGIQRKRDEALAKAFFWARVSLVLAGVSIGFGVLSLVLLLLRNGG